jgi:hypothetical protein
MTSTQIGTRLLFDPIACAEFITALGLAPQDAHFRGIHWDKTLLPKSARACHLAPCFEPRQAKLEQLQQQGYRLYWLPNGGPTDDDVASCPLLFVEWDDKPIDWQLAAWRHFGLPEPTVMLNTGGKSVHCYWRLAEPIDTDRWRAITQRLIAYCESDRTCKNPSRLMRLAGSSYIYKSGDKAPDGSDIGGMIGPAPATVISSNPQAVYRVELFEERLPQLPQPKTEPLPLLDQPAAPPPVGTPSARPLADLDRMMAAYPQILPDNDQYEEAVELICSFIAEVEESGGTREQAIAIASRYHPGAADTFDNFRRGAIKARTGAFTKKCKALGIDTKRADLRPEPQQPPPTDGLIEEAPQPWSPEDPEDAEEVAELREEVIGLRRAGEFSIALHDVLPRVLAEELTQRAAAFPIDPLFFLLPLLCTTAGVVGRRLEVVRKRGFSQPLVLWGANVAPPGSLKTPAAKVVSGPLYRWQKRLIKKGQDDLANWKRAHADAKASEDPALEIFLAENPQPATRRVVVGDTTIERIGQYFCADGTHGIVSFHDELSKWFDNLQRGGKDSNSDVSSWCEGYDSGTLDVGRTSREDIFVPDCPISLFGSIQPSKMKVARAAAAKRNNGDADGDGLLGRLVMVLPWKIRWRDNDLEADISDLLFNLLRDQIDQAIPPMRIAGDGDAIPTALVFEPEALRQVVIPHLHELGDECDRSKGERAQWLDKARGRLLRLAGVLHVLKQATTDAAKITDPITRDTCEKAVLLSRFFLAQYDLAMAEFGADEKALPKEIASLITKGREWRQSHGSAPVPGHVIRKHWCLPDRQAKAKHTNDWLLAAIGEDPSGLLGWVERLRQGVRWHPPASLPPAE